MKRYFKSFALTSFIYLFLFVSLLFGFDSIKKVVPQKDEKLISLNQLYLVPEEKQVKNSIKKDIQPPKKKIEKKIVKKEIPKKKIEKKIVKKTTPTKEITKKLVKKIEKEEPRKELVKNEEITDKKIVKEEIKNNKDTTEKKVVKNYTKDYMDKHLKQIVQLIQQNIKYPRRARVLSIEGKVVVEFRILNTGEVINITPLEGHKFLIKSSINAIKEASKGFPKVTKEIKIKVPIFYKLV